MKTTWLAARWAAFVVGPLVALVVIAVNVALRT
jgi:hypothetical protein